ncbi:MAG: hypothetical protein ACTHU0_34065 [Kofleriaceae bacterium]
MRLPANMNTRTASTVLALALASLTACKKKDEAGKSGEPAASKTAPAGKAAPAAEAPGAPLKSTPEELFADLSKERSGMDALDALKKYEAGVTFTGKVKTASAEEDGTPVIFLEAGDKHMVSLQWADAGPVKAKGVKVGDSLTVTCKVGGVADAVLIVTDCKL